MSNTDFRYFPYIIRDIVSQVRTKYDSIDLLKPYFEFGTYLELIKRVAIKDQNDLGKYPMIWLVWEANESLQTWNSEVTYNVSPRLFIVNHTSSDYSSVERYDNNFIGILFPIFELLKSYMKFNEFMTSTTIFDYQLAEHLLWGESLKFQKKQNILNDTLDAIEIKFNNLEINKIC